MPEENEPFHIKYRPQTIDEFVGNSIMLKSLQDTLSKPGKPHAYLFHGPSGCGKTSIARILATELGCSTRDLHELNSANYRGIESVRELISKAGLRPWEGKVMVYIMDECFAKGTLVSTNNGQIPIEEIKVGDDILNINGFAKVKKVFKNTVPINRTIKLEFDNDKTLFTTNDHLFLTQNGWLKASELRTDNLLLCVMGNIMDDNNLPITHKGVDNESLWMVWHKIQNKVQEYWAINLLKKLWAKTSKQKERAGEIRSTLLQMVQRIFGAYPLLIPEAILQPILCEQMEKQTARNSSENVYIGKEYKSQKRFGKIQERESKTGKRDIEISLKTYERKQPIKHTRSNRESKGNKTVKWDTAYLAGNSWWQWAINGTSNTVIFSFRLANRIGNIIRKKETRIPNKLQSGYSQPETQISNRSGWAGAHGEESYFKRCQERKGFEVVRLVSSEVYQPGNNDRSFPCIENSKTSNQEFVTFYDLEIDGHPSYFVEGIPVHNCHMLTREAQNALLKLLEEPPGHVYFALCTTDPDKLLKTIRTRCAQFAVVGLGRRQITTHLHKIAGEEGIELDPVISKEIARACSGSMRQAVMVLDQIINMEDLDEALEAIHENMGQERQTIDLCRALIANDVTWHTLAPILVELQSEPESTRHAVLGYFNTVALKSKNPWEAMVIIKHFSQSIMYSGRAGLALACWNVTEEFNPPVV